MWWRTAVPYDDLALHLRGRHMDLPVRQVTGAICAALCGIALLTLAMQGGPQTTVQYVLIAIAAVCAGSGALLWTTRWPTSNQAVGFSVVATVGVATAALAQESPATAITACAVFAATASYIALFHTAALMLGHVAVVGAVTGFEAYRLASITDVASGVGAFAIIAVLNLAVPFGVQLMVHALGTEAVVADFDQLTGLLTRRAFTRRAAALIAERAVTGSGWLAVIVIDLDRFKQVNDTRGHSTGDQALVAVARELGRHGANTSIIGRIGGEEFAFVDTWPPTQVELRTRRLRGGIARLPFDITASIGTVVADFGTPDSAEASLDALLYAADQAMYVAKRRGGDQVFHGVLGGSAGDGV